MDRDLAGSDLAKPVRRGAAPLPQALALAPLLREITGLALAQEIENPALDALLDQLQAAEKALRNRLPADLAPRIGGNGSAPETGGRVYLDHSHDIGAYNAGFPEYELTVDGDVARGSVEFPLAFEGPPGLVWGGTLSCFFDAVIQQHNCELGIAGQTVSLHVDYLRPTPLLQPLDFGINRTADGRRSTSVARLYRAGTTLCTATVVAVAGDVTRLARPSPRRVTS